MLQSNINFATRRCITTFLTKKEFGMACFNLNDNFSKECFETILQTMAEALFIIDNKGIIKFCNRSMETLTGLSNDKLVGNKCVDIMSCPYGTVADCDLFRLGVLNNVECRLKVVGREGISLLKNGRIMYDNNGNVQGAVETMTDISALKKTELRIAQLEMSIKEKEHYHKIIGKSRIMQQLFELIDLAASSNVTILINGETGTGKEITAEAIHEKSIRKDGPLIKVNCSALSESLLESELFGHTKGAFTNAIKDKIGRFELADGGTLFLDEIGEISPLIQLKLLRFLQEREFERVGESITHKANVRIIAATNRDLFSMTKQGKFRQDLYYRLKVFPIRLPPLRERKEDIGLLVKYFIDKYNKETGKKLIGLSHNAAITLMDYCWPGNIRELENAIEHAFVTCKEGEIDIFDLPLEIRKVELRGILCKEKVDLPPVLQLHDRNNKKKKITREELISLLNHYNWNKSDVARHLNVDRTTIWRKIKKLRIPQKNPHN